MLKRKMRRRKRRWIKKRGSREEGRCEKKVIMTIV